MLRIVNKILTYSFYALFALTPFVFNASRIFPSYELFEWNKMMFVYFLTILIAGSWSMRMLLHKRFIFSPNPLTFPLILFLLSQILATLFSIDPHVSLWGYYSRFHGGLMSSISYVILYFAFISNRDLIHFPTLIIFSLSSGVFVATYGILEKFGIDAHMWIQDVRARVFSTLGQPNWLAAYLDIVIFLAMGFFLNEKFKDQNVKLQSKIVKNFDFAVSVCILIFYVCILFTRSRSGFIGFWLSNAAFWGILYFTSQKNRSAKNVSYKNQFPKRLFIIINLFFLIFNFFLTTPFSQYNKIASIQLFQSTPAPIPPPSTSDTIIDVGITDSAKIRSIVWKGAVDIVKAYPLFGTGPETFAYSYYKFRPAEHNLTSEWDFLYNKAHNEYLNIAATSGLIGFGAYLYLIFIVIRWTLKSILSADENKILYASILAAYIGILITNFFGFSVVIVGVYFFLLPAFIFTVHHSTTFKVEEDNTKSFSVFGMVSIGVIVFISLMGLGKMWIADSFYAKSVSYSRLENFSQAHENINAAIKLRKNEPNFYDQKSSVSTSLALTTLENGESSKSSQYALEAVEMSQKALEISPQNVNFWKTRTKVYFFLSEIDSSFISDAIASIQIARELAPTDAKIAYNEAIILGRASRNDEAVSALETAIRLKPDYRDAYIALSIFYKEANNIDKAREILEQVLIKINPDDEEIKQRLLELN